MVMMMIKDNGLWFFCAARFVRRLKDKEGYNKFASITCWAHDIFRGFDANKQACVMLEEEGIR